MGRLDEAIAEADKIITSRLVDESRNDAILFKGECLISAEQLESAFATYDLVETEWEAPYAQEAFFNMGEIRFYQAYFDDAVSYYNVALRQYPAESV